MSRLEFQMIALAAAVGLAGQAQAAGSGATIQVAARGTAQVAARGRTLAVRTEGEPTAEPGAARVTISRAADHVGRPVYFSRSAAAGSAGLVSFSSRQLPASAVFSVALRPLGPVLPSLATAALAGAMPSRMPVAARAMTSGFGWRQHPILGTLRAHSGIDLAAGYGAPIVATSDGVVGSADWAGGYGLMVALDHGAGLQTRYAHMSRLAVAPGQPVRKGEVIGYVGSTGRSTGPHLHYEIRVNGQAVNPAGHLHGR